MVGIDEEEAKRYLEFWKGKDVYLLCGNTDWGEAEISKAAECAKKAGFQGLCLDCEVWQDGVPKSQQEAFVEGVSKTRDFPVLVCTPYWFEYNERLAKAADGLVVLTYYVGHEDLAEPTIRMCESAGKPVLITLELQAPNEGLKPENTYNGDIAAAIAAVDKYKYRTGLALHYLQVMR